MNNPYTPGSGYWHNFEHRFERLKLPNGELHPWHCSCSMCDIIKHHCPNDYIIVVVDEPSDYYNHRPNSENATIDKGNIQ
jgi:hypothetical protein